MARENFGIGTERNEGENERYGLPRRLAGMRKRKRMSRAVLGECCGLSKNVIALYETGQRTPSVDSLVALADFFEVSTDFLLGRADC